jgi:hypothetical protein
MNWHSVASFALGFAMMPATIGLIGLFVYISARFNLDGDARLAGIVVAIALLLCAFAAGIILFDHT